MAEPLLVQEPTVTVDRLPPDVRVVIFDYVLPRDIVCNCRLVSKAWKEFLDDPYFWQRKMIRAGNFSDKLLPLKSINWAMLYANTVYRRNILRAVRNGELTLDSSVWTVRYEDWDTFKAGRHLRIRQPSPPKPRYGGRGSSWIIENGCIGDDETRLRAENEGCSQNYATSYTWCCKDKVIDLHCMGVSQELLDNAQPSIVASEWFAARFDCGSIYNLHVALLNSKYENVTHFDHQVTTPQWVGGELGWRRVEHTFTEYGKGVKYIRFAHAGKDTQFWAGHYGSKMAGSQVTICFYPL
jgi:hypothetical protein